MKKNIIINVFMSLILTGFMGGCDIAEKLNSENSNKHAPMFKQQSYEFTVTENRTFIGRVEATDADKGSKIEYSVTPNLFVIDKNLGDLRFQTAPTGNFLPLYTPIVTAFDGEFSTDITVIVTIINLAPTQNISVTTPNNNIAGDSAEQNYDETTANNNTAGDSTEQNYDETTANNNTAGDSAEQNYDETTANNNTAGDSAEQNYDETTANNNIAGDSAEQNYDETTANNNTAGVSAEQNYDETTANNNTAGDVSVIIADTDFLDANNYTAVSEGVGEISKEIFDKSIEFIINYNAGNIKQISDVEIYYKELQNDHSCYTGGNREPINSNINNYSEIMGVYKSMSEALVNQNKDVTVSNMVLGAPGSGTSLVQGGLLDHAYRVKDYVTQYGYAVDRDEDCYVDNSDDFPDDPTEWRDLDYDGIGDNTDEFPYDANNGNPVNVEDVFSDVHSEQFQPGTGEISLDVLEAAYQLVDLVNSGQTLSIEQLNLFYTIIKNDISNYTGGNGFAPKNFSGSDNYDEINIYESMSMALGEQGKYITIENILYGGLSGTLLVQTGLYQQAIYMITYGKIFGYKSNKPILLQ